ncbi:MAG: amidohydrolase family protein [Segetibacter sp.]
MTIYSFGQNSTLIKAGKFYNSQTNTFQKDIQILITNETVEKVGTNISVPANTKLIECTNCTVTPGLIDMHTHLLYKENPYAKSVIEDGINNTDADRSLRAVKTCHNYLIGGITSVRDLGNSGEYLDVSLRNGINAGYFQGPTMFVSGPIISPYGGQTYNLPFQSQHLVDKEYRVVKNVDDARLAVQEHIKMGVDLIKICADNSPGNLMLSFDEIKAITETAHEYGLKVTAHATFDKSVRRAILAGVDGIEHGYDISDSTLDLMKKEIFISFLPILPMKVH